MHDNLRNERSNDVFRDISPVRRINTLHQKVFEERDSLIKIICLRLFLLLRFEFHKLVFYRFYSCFDLSRFVQKKLSGNLTVSAHLDQITQAIMQLGFLIVILLNQAGVILLGFFIIFVFLYD